MGKNENHKVLEVVAKYKSASDQIDKNSLTPVSKAKEILNILQDYASLTKTLFTFKLIFNILVCMRQELMFFFLEEILHQFIPIKALSILH